MAEPFFTIVIPTYNRADHLPKAIEAVLAQDFGLFELIVVDDGSTDNTESIVKEYDDGRVHYVRQVNSERAAARNTGIRSARGVYTTFLDSDDLVLSNHLSTAKKFADKFTPSIFHLGYNVCSPEGSLMAKWKPLPSPLNQKLLDGNYLSCMGVFLHREVFSKYLFNEDRALSGSEDYEYWLRLSARYNILACPEVTGILVNHEARSVIQTDAASLTKRIALLRKYLKEDQLFMDKYGTAFSRKDAYLDVYVALHLSLMKGRSAQAMHTLWLGFKKHPAIIFSKRFWVIPKKILIG